jgi:hypothetical protein
MDTFNKAIFVAILAIAFPAIVHAGECRFDPAGFTLSWTAFKTPAKAGLTGTFSKYETAGDAVGSNVPNALNGASITIVTGSVSTKNTARDMTLSQNFFGQFKGDTITATISGATGNNEEGKLKLGVKMNGITLEVPMSFIVAEGSLTATGYIDMLDFALETPLASLANACKPMHQGKTWNDIVINFTAPVTCGN